NNNQTNNLLPGKFKSFFDKISEKFKEYQRTKGTFMSKLNTKTHEVIDPVSKADATSHLKELYKFRPRKSKAAKKNKKALFQKWLVEEELNDQILAKKKKIIGGGEENNTQNNNSPPDKTSNQPNLFTFCQKSINNNTAFYKPLF
ncbi:23578_t:CDS:2, partial [Gigaspora margarita]